ncbi:hypothetical protein HK104_009565 [Borealophlyctis nickersoniae]|nr:hypothetical protein HK104_009565 [Borealophlyctis nickersoniae]
MSEFEEIASIYQGKTVGPEAVFEVAVVASRVLDGTKTYILTLCDEDGTEIDMYLHQKFYILAEGGLGQGLERRQIRLTGTRSVPTAGNSARLLPTDLMVFVIAVARDEAFLLEHFSHALKDITPADIQAGKQYCLLVKIIQIGTPHAARTKNRLKRLDIFVNDSTVNQNISLVLWDEQISMASLFRQGDWLAIWCPYIAPDYTFSSETGGLEYGTKTMLFCVPMDPSKELQLSSTQSQLATPSQHPIPRDERGILDYKRYPERVMIRDLARGMINVTLYGRVVHLEGNMPVELTGVKEDRYGLRLADETGECDITLRNEVGRSAARLRVGQYILLENIITITNSRRGGFYVVGSKEEGSTITNASALRGMLSSPFLRTLRQLHDAFNGENVDDHFYARAIICAWGKDANEMIHVVHRRCKRALEVTDGVFWCSFCAEFAEDHEQAYALSCLLDDSTASIHAELGYGVVDDILGISPSEFLRLTPNGQQQDLSAAVGTEVICSIVTWQDSQSQVPWYRVEAVQIAWSRVHDVKNLLRELQSTAYPRHLIRR